MYKGVLSLDLNHDGRFLEAEVQDITPSKSRGKFWYSAKSTINLPATENTTRPYPVNIWYVLDPSEDQPSDIIRWSRRGWHEGKFKFNDAEFIAVVSDRNSDGVFSSEDAWGMGATPKEAYGIRNSASPVDSHAWLESVAWQIVDCDQNGRFINIRAIDVGMSEAEDRQRKDPYAADKKYRRSESPVKFTTDFESALAQAKKENKQIVVDFVTTWCGPCKMMDRLVYTAKPVVDISADFVFVKLDGDEEKDLNEKFEVAGYPTLLLLDSDGKIIRRRTGYQGVKEMLEFVK